MSYRIQLHPQSAPATVRSREDVDKIVALFDRMKRSKVRAHPFFIFPAKFPLPAQLNAPGVKLPNIPICSVAGKGEKFRECYRFNLAMALNDLRRAEGLEVLGMEEAEAEAEEYLSLIAEYRALPESGDYTKEEIDSGAAFRADE